MNCLTALCTEPQLPMIGLSSASVHRAGSVGSGCKEPEAQAVVWGRASAVMPPCGRLCYCRQKTQQTHFFHKLLWRTRDQKTVQVKSRQIVPVKGRSLPCVKSLLQLPDLTGLSRLTKQAHFVQATLPDEVHTLLHHQRNQTHPITSFIQYRLLQTLTKHPCKGRRWVSSLGPLSTSSNQKQDNWSCKKTFYTVKNNHAQASLLLSI